jgi:hypothetical protein
MVRCRPLRASRTQCRRPPMSKKHKAGDGADTPSPGSPPKSAGRSTSASRKSTTAIAADIPRFTARSWTSSPIPSRTLYFSAHPPRFLWSPYSNRRLLCSTQLGVTVIPLLVPEAPLLTAPGQPVNAPSGDLFHTPPDAKLRASKKVRTAWWPPSVASLSVVSCQ